VTELDTLDAVAQADLVRRGELTATELVSAAIERIGRSHAELGRHLDASVRTGTLCVYQPETPRVWTVRQEDRK